MRTSKAAVIALLLVLIIVQASVLVVGQEPPKLKGARTTPNSGDDMDTYVFTVSYADADNESPTKMVVIIDGTEYPMEPADPSDNNFTDGKEYFFKRTFSEGTYYHMFKASDGHNTTNTLVTAVHVKSTSIFRMEHSDIIRVSFMLGPAFGVLLVILILELYWIGRILKKGRDDIVNEKVSRKKNDENDN